MILSYYDLQNKTIFLKEKYAFFDIELHHFPISIPITAQSIFPSFPSHLKFIASLSLIMYICA